MKLEMILKNFVLLFCVLIISGCNGKKSQKILDGFGELKLGITTQQFKTKFNKNLDLTPSSMYGKSLSAEVSNVKISSNINLVKVHLEFRDDKLIHIGTDGDELYNFLCENYSITKQEKVGPTIIGDYKTNDKNIHCEFILGENEEYGKYKALGIFYMDNHSR